MGFEKRLIKSGTGQIGLTDLDSFAFVNALAFIILSELI